ncbi:MAG: DUF507 family protein [Candidatus Binatia bacterium]
MPPTDKDLHRAASRLVNALVEKQLLQPRDTPAELEKRVFAALQKNFREEAEIEREAQRVLAENQKLSAGMDQRTLLVKIRQKIARDRGFVL